MNILRQIASMMKITCAVGLCSLGVATPVSHAADQKLTAIWSQESVADAMATAMEQNKPVLLYWGATWCPPCNQLKSQVFSHPEFARATAPFIRIMLDGDLPGAQEWADRLNVSGYPTVLVLAPEKSRKKTILKERLRLVEFVDFQEFSSLVHTALSESLPLKQDLIRKGLRKKATAEEWQLIGYTWNAAETIAGTPEREIKKTLRQLKQLFKNCPDRRVKSILAARILNLDDGFDPKWINAITDDENVVFAARGPFLAGAAQWQERSPAGIAKSTGEKILTAAGALLKNQELSLTEKLQTQTLILDVTNQLVGKGLLPPKNLTSAREGSIRMAVEMERQSKTPYERHAVVTDAAMLLFAAGKSAEAKKMLTTESQASDTPWYYESALAGLALQENDFPAALEWSRRARASARGTATKVQWLVSDIVLQAQVIADLADAKIPAVASLLEKQNTLFQSSVDEWLKLATTLPDGFSGRNALRARKVRAAIKNWSTNQDQQGLLTKWAESCKLIHREGKKEAAKSCRALLK